MRILGLLNADKDSDAGVPPTRELLESMGRFIEEVTNAGVLIAADGPQPSSTSAARIPIIARARVYPIASFRKPAHKQK